MLFTIWYNHLSSFIMQLHRRMWNGIWIKTSSQYWAFAISFIRLHLSSSDPQRHFTELHEIGNTSSHVSELQCATFAGFREMATVRSAIICNRAKIIICNANIVGLNLKTSTWSDLLSAACVAQVSVRLVCGCNLIGIFSRTCETNSWWNFVGSLWARSNMVSGHTGQWNVFRSNEVYAFPSDSIVQNSKILG